MPINIGAVAPAPAAGALGPVGGAGAGAGALPGTYNPASGGIPQTPTPSQSLANLIAGIQGNIGGLGSVIGGVTQAENQALRDQYPDEYFNTLGTLQGNVARRAQGDALDLIPMWAQNAAEWGIGQGVSGPALASKFAKDVFGGIHNLQRQAIQDEATLKGLYPTVAPYSADRLLPTFGDQIGWEDVGNVRGAAPIPEAAYGRARADALAGLNRGFNAGGGAGFGGGVGRGFTPFTPPTPAAPAQVSPFFNPAGGGGANWLGQAGVERGPAEVPGPIFGPQWGGVGVPWQGGPAFFDDVANLWDQPFDMPQGFDDFAFDEEFFM